jgi:hypothetical protein
MTQVLTNPKLESKREKEWSVVGGQLKQTAGEDTPLSLTDH